MKSNGTISSAPASQQDIQDITKMCFDNRVADIGQFLRDHLTDENFHVLKHAVEDRVRDYRQELDEFAVSSAKAFKKSLKKNGGRLMDNEYGWMHATFLSPCDLSAVRPDKEWISSLLRQNPNLTGWPFFVDLWTPRKPEFKPQIINGIWEAKLVGSDDDFGEIDHWRIDAKRGFFYAARALEDDTSTGSPKPRETLDFGLSILRTAEILAIAVRFASFLCGDNSDINAKVSLTIKWTGLQDRILSSWANPGRHLSENYQCHTDTVSKIVEVPFASSHDQIVLFTQEIVGELFLQFDGWACPSVVVEDIVGRLLNRKL